MRALVFDLDDTLLNSMKQIGPDTLASLDEWIASGREVILATSRPIRAVRAFVPAHLLQQSEVLSLNGAVCHSGGELSYRSSRLGTVAQAIVHDFPADGTVHYSFEIDGDSFATNANYSDAELLAFHSATREMVVEMKQLDFTTISKIAVDGLGLRIDFLIPTIEKLGASAIPCMDGTFLNVVDRSVDKASALMRHINSRGLSRDEFAVFGDDIPDIKMMRLTDHAVAMGNAPSRFLAMNDNVRCARLPKLFASSTLTRVTIASGE